MLNAENLDVHNGNGNGNGNLEEIAAFNTYGVPSSVSHSSNAAAINASMLLLQSESTDTNTSQEEVDPKSQLANKTIFKTDNPNLSIIEINENSIKEEDLEKEVVLIEQLSTDDNNEAVEKVKNILKKSPNKVADNATDKRRRKADTLLQSSKQKLDISIAEASAAADGVNDRQLQLAQPTVAVIDQPQTKREIVIYDTLEEFDQNLPSTVTLLNTPFGSKVYLVGTAHFSEESQDDVSYVRIPAIIFKLIQSMLIYFQLPSTGHSQCPSRCGHGGAMSLPCTHTQTRWEDAAGGGQEYQYTQGN